MGGPVRRAGAASALALMPGVAGAECLGQNCYGGIVAVLLMIALYLGIGVVLLVLMATGKWRAWRWILGLVLAVALGIPALSQLVLAWKVRAMENREIAGQPPPLAARKPLLIVLEGYCSYGPCREIMRQQGDILVLTDGDDKLLSGLDLTRPQALSALPIMYWSSGDEGYDIGPRRAATAEEIAALDYVVLVRQPWYGTVSTPLDDALRANPALGGARRNETVKLGLAPLSQAGQLDLAALRFDSLDLWLTDGAYVFPFLPGVTFGPDDAFSGLEAVAASVCSGADGPDGTCLDALR